MRYLRYCIVLSMLLVLAACASTTSITSPEPDSVLSLREVRLELPAQHRLRGTTFGNYEFKAQAPGQAPFYGVLPLNFKGAYLAADILFFAPATFFNLRGAFPFYEIDVSKQVVRFKRKAADPWTEIQPKQAEEERARNYFGGERP